MDEAVRITFEYRGGEIVARTVDRVKMRVPAAAHDEEAHQVHGRFLELRSADGAVVSATPLAHQGPPIVEYPTGDPKHPFGRAEAPPGTIVSVLVEADDRATHAALVDVARPKGLIGVLTEMVGAAPRRRDLLVVPLPGEAETGQ